MTEAEAILERKYKDTFEEEIRGLERRRAYDPNLTIEYLEGTLKSLYVFEGNDWEGRGAVLDEVIRAQIAAYETFIENWKKEKADAQHDG